MNVIRCKERLRCSLFLCTLDVSLLSLLVIEFDVVPTCFKDIILLIRTYLEDKNESSELLIKFLYKHAGKCHIALRFNVKHEQLTFIIFELRTLYFCWNYECFSVYMYCKIPYYRYAFMPIGYIYLNFRSTTIWTISDNSFLF